MRLACAAIAIVLLCSSVTAQESPPRWAGDVIDDPSFPGSVSGPEDVFPDHSSCCANEPFLDPVDITNGAFLTQEVDLAIPGIAGLDFEVVRSYHSRYVLDGPFGKNWDSPLFMRISVTSVSSSVLYYNGRMRPGVVFDEDTVGPALVTYSTPTGFYFSLKKLEVLPDEWEFELTDSAGRRIRFDRAWLSSSAGQEWYRLKYVEDSNGNRITYAYDEDSVLIGITDSMGRSASLEYVESGINQGRIKRITDAAGRTVEYGYNVSGQLKSVKLPPTAEYPDGSVVNYTYNNQNRLLTIKDAGATEPYLVNTFDAQGRVKQQQYGDAGQVSHVDYSQTPYITVTDAEGDISEYEIDSTGAGRINAITLLDADDPEIEYTTRFFYDANGANTGAEYPDGRTLTYVYDEANPDPRARHNLLEMTDTAASGESRTTKWTYEGPYNHVKTHYSAQAVADGGGVTDDDLATRYSYDPNGNLTSIRLPLATTWDGGVQETRIEYTHDAYGRVDTVTDAHGVVTDYVYDTGSLEPFPREIIRDPGGHGLSTKYEYDAAFNLTREYTGCACGPGSTDVTFDHDERGNVMTETHLIDAERTATITYKHNEMGYVTEIHRSDDSEVGDGIATTLISYNLRHQPTSVTMDVDETRTVGIGASYDKEGRVERYDFPSGRALRYEYDERDLVKALVLVATDGGELRTDYEHDPNGRVEVLTDAKSTARTVIWNGFDEPKTETDLLGNTWHYEWNADGQLEKEWLVDAGETTVSEGLYDWDEQGRLIRVQELALDSSGAPLGSTDYREHRHWYAATGQLEREELVGGASTHYVYNALGRLESIRDSETPASGIDFDYHPNGLLRGLSAVEGDDATQTSIVRAIADNLEYNAARQLVSGEDAEGNITSFEWSLGGKLAALVDRAGFRRELDYDELGRVIAERRYAEAGATQSPDDVVVEIEYDGYTLEVVRAANAAGAQETTYAYTPFGAVESVTFADGTTHGFADHDEYLMPLTTTDRAGNVMSFSRDPLGRPDTVAITPVQGVGGETNRSYGWSPTGRLLQVDNDSFSVARSFNSLGGLESETVTSNQTLEDRLVSATHDAFGRLRTLVYPRSSGAEPVYVTYDMDDAGRTRELLSTEGVTETTIASWDYLGHRVTQLDAPNATASFAYDALGLLDQISLESSSGPVADFEYDHDVRPSLQGMGRTYYDGAGQAQSLSEHSGWTALQFDGRDQLEYAAGGLTEAAYLSGNHAAALRSLSLDYDSVWNRLLVDSASASEGSSVDTYVPNAVNAYDSVTSSTQIVHDAEGNLTSNDPHWTLSYDHAGRPIQIDAGGVSYAHRYDGLGRRIETDFGDVSERYSYWGWQLIDQTIDDATGTTRLEYLHGDDLDDTIVMRDPTSGAEYTVLADERGNPSALIDSAGNVAESYRYTEFGRRIRVDPDSGAPLMGEGTYNPIGYQGRWALTSGGDLLDFRHRAYSTEWGRFVQPDPLGYPDGNLNRYQKTHNNPWRRDPLGLFEDGKLSDSSSAWTHVGITKRALEALGLPTEGSFTWQHGAIDDTYYYNWLQDNSPAVAGLDDYDNARFHALGPEALRTWWLEKHKQWVAEECSWKQVGIALHFVQDYVSHRNKDGETYPLGKGHLWDSAGSMAFDVYNAPDPLNPFSYLRNGAAIEPYFNPDTTRTHGAWSDLQAERVGQAVTLSKKLITHFMAVCGDDGTSSPPHEFDQGNPLVDDASDSSKPATTIQAPPGSRSDGAGAGSKKAGTGVGGGTGGSGKASYTGAPDSRPPRAKSGPPPNSGASTGSPGGGPRGVRGDSPRKQRTPKSGMTFNSDKSGNP